ncbi:MAG: hypothetical protein RLZ10_2364 [Bacteroidota bacterium]|jgi:hypothetical protein
MKDVIFIEGLGWVKEVTINRINEYGINEPFTEYQLINQ